MALIVEDGTGLQTAESYLSVADCSTTLAKFGKEAAFDALATEAEKEQALRIATQYIDSTYGDDFSGEVKGLLQSLEWPRIAAYNSRGQLITEGTLPQELLNAVAMATNDSLTNDLFSDESNGALISSEAVGIGGGAITESLSYVGGKSNVYVSTDAKAYIKPLITGQGAQEVLRG